MNGTYESCDDVEGVEGPYSVYHCENEGSHAMHHGYDGDMRYNYLSHKSYECFEQNLKGNGSHEVEFSSSSCVTSYSKKEGINVWEGPFQGCCVDHRKSDKVGGRGGGTLSHEVVDLRESFTTLREDFDDFLRMYVKVKSMVQKRQVIHHEDMPKELPLE
ncbi:hypothetical protein EJD97_007063 [Solanum chilense]|uniref:Uncharacterized protein n=1 Tax=Solanum chilense TaxID=4083 RepID=A0A6N2AKP6_SOLCI|nr:hypothetical protein EJD97_007063 [Solanum chilense]